jgi:hypothetical protein
MITLTAPFRLATPDDAPALVDFVDYASSGMSMVVWAQMAGSGREPRTVVSTWPAAKAPRSPIEMRSLLIKGRARLRP